MVQNVHQGTVMKKWLDWDEMLKVPERELAERSLVPIEIYEDSEEMFYTLARRTIDLIKENNEKGEITRIAWPIGPKRNFPILAKMTNEENVSWKNTVNYQVDEWLTWDCRKLPKDNPFNLEEYLKRELFGKIRPELRPQEDRIFFHNPAQMDYVEKKIDEFGGIDILFGGFGFTGHIAYNEPPVSRWFEVSPEEFLNARTHIVNTNEETFIMHSHRSAGGNTKVIPPMGITLGFKDIMAAKKIVLVTDGGAWKQTILRVMCFCRPEVRYPCTFVQEHPDTLIMVDAESAKCPVVGM